MDFDFQKEESSTSLQATPSLAKPIGVRREAIYRLPAWDPAKRAATSAKSIATILFALARSRCAFSRNFRV
jgi:hypothetical protein